jgi:adiponectin receptor
MDRRHQASLRRRTVSVDAAIAQKTSRDRVTVGLEHSPSHSAAVTAIEGSDGEQEWAEEEDLVDPEGAAERNQGGENSDSDDSVHSEGSLIAASLHRIGEAVSGIGETMGHIEGKLEEKMSKIGEKMVEIESCLNEKVGQLEAKIEEKVEKTKANIEKIAHWAWKSMPFDKLPLWLQDNEYLTHEHRPPMNSFRGCFKSMFRMHTETWNIWTHFIGFIFFVALCLGIYVYGDYITFLFEDVEVYKLPATEQGMLFCFFFGAMICLSCSTMFHLFQNHSYGVYRLFSCLDYSGIAILITGSSIPAYYYGFYCSLLARYTHIVIVAVLCVACVVISLWKKFSTPKYRPLRFATFVLFGVYGVIPSLQIALSDGFAKQHIVQAGTGILTMGGLYLIGALLYVCRCPERFFPGKFNTWASSHQLFHICVVCAALVHYDTLLNMIKYRLSTDSCALELIHTLPNLDFATA